MLEIDFIMLRAVKFSREMFKKLLELFLKAEMRFGGGNGGIWNLELSGILIDSANLRS